MITAMIEPDNWLTKPRQRARRLVVRAGLSDEDIDRMIKQAQRNQSVRDGSSKYPRFPGESRDPPVGGTSGGDMCPGFRRDSGPGSVSSSGVGRRPVWNSQ
jgi:hypothetical protein